MKHLPSWLKLLTNMGALLFLLFSMLVGPVSAQPVTQTPLTAEWIELQPIGSPPNPVYVPKPVHYDAENNRLIVFFPGNPPYNSNPPGNSNEVWVLTNANGLGGTPVWTKLVTSGTAPISNGLESVVYDVAANRLIVYGGCYANCSPALSGVFVLTNANGLGGTPAWSQTSITNSQDRADHSAVFDPVNNLMISFGGHHAFFGTGQNDTRVLSNANGLSGPSTWTTLTTSGSLPGIRGTLAAAYDQSNDRLIIFAGDNIRQPASQYNDAWVLQNASGLGGTPTWTQLAPQGSAPAVRGHLSGVYDPSNNRLLIFGGANNNATLGDLWELSYANGLGGTPAWTEITQTGDVPGPRFYHTAAFDAAHQRMIVLGGRDGSDTPSNRVWVLQLGGTTLTASTTASTELYPGDPVSVDLTIENANNLYAAQATCSADPAILEPQNATFGDFFDVINRLVGANNVDAAAGTWLGAISQRSPAGPLSGDGLFATLNYEAVSPGATDITCDPLLADQNGFTQPVTYSGVSLTVLPFANVSGVAQYQGRLVHDGITITATGPIAPTVTTDSDGNFVLDLKTGTYTVVASATGYLPNTTTVDATSGQAVTLPSTTLKGGSANGDTVIDIGDATLVAANFGLSIPPGDSRADINGDGIVNVQDLAILGSNYGLAGEQPW